MNLGPCQNIVDEIRGVFFYFGNRNGVTLGPLMHPPPLESKILGMPLVLTELNGPGRTRTVANRTGTAMTGAVRTGRQSPMTETASGFSNCHSRPGSGSTAELHTQRMRTFKTGSYSSSVRYVTSHLCSHSDFVSDFILALSRSLANTFALRFLSLQRQVM